MGWIANGNTGTEERRGVVHSGLRLGSTAQPLHGPVEEHHGTPPPRWGFITAALSKGGSSYCCLD